MRKRGKRFLSVFLSICMVFGLMTGIPVYADENGEGEEQTGLLVTQDIDFENACVGQDPYYAKEMTAPVVVWPSYHFIYKADADAEPVTVTKDSLSVTIDGADAVEAGKVELRSMDRNEELVEISFKETGDYTLTYNGAETNNTVAFHVACSKLGFYSADVAGPDTFVGRFEWSDANENYFYMVTSLEDGFSISENSIVFSLDSAEGDVTDPDTLAEYFTTEPVAGKDNVYKVSVVKQEDFSMSVSAEIVTTEGATWTERTGVEVSFVQSKDGLVYKDWMEWDDDGNPYVSSEATFEKEMYSSPNENKLVYLAYLTSEDDENPTTVKANNISITYEGAAAGETEVTYSECEQNSDLISITFMKVGDYVITYSGEGEKDKTIKVHVDWSEIAFYKEATKSAENVLDGRFEYYNPDDEDAKTFYMILYTGDENTTVTLDGISITDYDKDATYSSADKVAEYITYTPVTGQTGVYKVVVQTQDSFGINAKVSLSDGNNTWETERYLDVEYVQKNDGLVAKDWIDWDDDGKPYINEDATFTKELWTSPGNDRLAYFAYLTSEEDENPTTVKAADITVTCGGVTAGEDKVVVKACDENEDLISFSFKAVGDYVITYTGTGDKNKSVTMHVQYPEVGFYTAATISENNLLDGRFEYDDTEAESAKTFYMILHTDDADATVSLKDTPFQINDYDKNETYTDADKVAEYISYAPVAGQSGVYKIIVQTESEFNLTAFAQVSAGEDNSWDTENSVEVAWVPKIEGFVAKWPMWSEDNGFQNDPNEPWQKKIYTDLNTATLLLAYMESEDDDNPREIEGLSALSAYYGETAINLTEQNDYVSCERVRQEPEGAGGVYSFTFKKTGEYKLVYSCGTVSKTLKLVVEYPSIGLYRTDEITDAGFVSFENGYTWSGNDNTAYLIFNDHVTSVSDVTATVTDCFSDVVTLTEVEEKLYKLTFSKEASDFNVKLSAEVTYDWGSESFDAGLNVVYSDFVSGGVYTDGEAHLGYSGCYMTKEEFDRNTVFYNASKPLFWVHADTVQGVIDKLSKVASGEEVLYKEVVEATTGTTIPDTSSTTEGMEITNTGYILIAVSQHGNTDMQEQYVSSSGNMKGIIFEAGQDHFYTVHDKENGVYIEDTVYNLDLYRSHLNGRGFYNWEIKTMLPSDLEDESYVSYYKGDFYHVSNTSNGTQEYFTLGEKITYDSDKEDTQREWLDKMRSGGTTSDEGAFKHYMEPGKFPDMHVNVYCDMR